MTRHRRASTTLALALLVPLVLDGCGTFLSVGLLDPLDEPRMSETSSPLGAVYGGVGVDLAFLDMSSWWLSALLVLDLPLSACADTLLLPLTCLQELRSWWWWRVVKDAHAGPSSSSGSATPQ